MIFWEGDKRGETDKKREKLSVSPLIQICPKHSFTHYLSLFPLCSASSRDRGLLSFDLVSHSETQYQTRYEQKWETRDCLSTDNSTMSTAVICVMLSTGVSRPISLWAASLPACCLSIRPKTLLRTAVFLFPLFRSLYQIGQSLCFTSGHLIHRALPSGWSLGHCQHPDVHTHIDIILDCRCPHVHCTSKEKYLCTLLRHISGVNAEAYPSNFVKHNQIIKDEITRY